MLIHYPRGRTLEWGLAGHHLPERYTERIEIRADADLQSRELLGAGNILRSHNAPGIEIAV